MARTRYRSDPTAAVILFAMLAALMFYFFSIPELSRQEILPPISSYNNTWLSAAPGNIPTQATATDTMTLNFPSIEVDNTLVSEPQLLSNQFAVFTGVYSSQPQTLSFTVDNINDVSDARLSFAVSSKGGDGVLSVIVNGQSVYSSEPFLGQNVIFTVPSSALRDGANTVEFTVSSPGFKFWRRNSYVISNTVLSLVSFSSTRATVIQSFSLSNEEVANAQNAELMMFARTEAAGNLEININGVTLFKGSPNPTFQIEVPVNSLRTGQNTVTFGADRGGKFDLSFVQIDIQTETVEEGVNYFFTIDSTDWERVQTGVFTCELIIRKNTGAETVLTQLNSFSRSYSFSPAGEIRANVCDQLIEGSNKITLSATEPLTLAQVSVGINPR